ncbi:helix-turn-helix domain-containing protein [uncultured Salegentibacter sp.]|uniref:helix-turn-helix domain-containing protein n=1 Tax=uncultured Salegentibacter sp. TaxID=259320 RepID=UPI0030DA8572
MKEKKSDEFFDLEYLFDVTPDLLCIAGFDGYFRKINPAVIKTLEYSKEELLKYPITSFVHQEDKEATDKSRAQVIGRKPLLHFENRYISKSGKTIWLTWTSMGIPSKELVFGIAKDITYRKKLEEYRKISLILNTEEKEKGFNVDKKAVYIPSEDHSPANQRWILEFESLIRVSVGKEELNLKVLSEKMAMSERQLFRRLKELLGITPNHFIRIIRMQIAMNAIKSGNYRTISEISILAGYDTPHYFSKIFKEIYHVEVGDLL